MKLILIRHGETDYTAEKRYCGGSIDAPLNNVGIKQAQKLRRLLQKEAVNIVYTSPLVRAIQTTNIIFANRPACGEAHSAPVVAHSAPVEARPSGRPVKIYKAPLLRESNLGKWEGHTLSEIKKLYPADVNKWYEDPLRYGATDGETPIILQRRIKRFLKRLSNTYNKFRIRSHWGSKFGGSGLRTQNSKLPTIAIVTHSGPFRIIMGEVSGNGLKDFWKLEPKTCEYKIVHYK